MGVVPTECVSSGDDCVSYPVAGSYPSELTDVFDTACSVAGSSQTELTGVVGEFSAKKQLRRRLKVCSVAGSSQTELTDVVGEFSVEEDDCVSYPVAGLFPSELTDVVGEFSVKKQSRRRLKDLF